MREKERERSLVPRNTFSPSQSQGNAPGRHICLGAGRWGKNACYRPSVQGGGLGKRSKKQQFPIGERVKCQAREEQIIQKEKGHDKAGEGRCGVQEWVRVRGGQAVKSSVAINKEGK